MRIPEYELLHCSLSVALIVCFQPFDTTQLITPARQKRLKDLRTFQHGEGRKTSMTDNCGLKLKIVMHKLT